MEKYGFWSIDFTLRLEGEDVRWDDLDECTQEHIADCIKEGYVSGEMCVCVDDDEEDESDD